MSRQSAKRAAGLTPTSKAEKKRLRGEGVVHAQEDMSEGRRLRRSTRKFMSTAAAKGLPTYSMVTCDALSGVVALVDLGPESRAKTIRATLAALGASVAPLWSPIVTHVVWSEGGCRDVRARARALAAQVVSPLWVEACAIAQEHLPESSFPAAPRPSDLPSPRQMQQALKKAEMDNVPLDDLFNTAKAGPKSPKSRSQPSRRQKSPDSSSGSSDATPDTSTSSVKTRAMTRSASKAAAASAATASTPSATTTAARESTDVESRVNTAPRRALPMSMTPPEPISKPAKKPQPAKQTQPEKAEPEPDPKGKPPKQPKKSKRKLFNQNVLPNADTESGPSSSAPGPSIPTVSAVSFAPFPPYEPKVPSAPPDPSAPTRMQRPVRKVRAAAARARAERAEPPGTTRLTQRDRSGLQRAERIARSFSNPILTPRPIYKDIYSRDNQHRIVLSGVSASERRLLTRTCRRLGATLMEKVDRTTTHVLVGSLSRILIVDHNFTEIYHSNKGCVDKILAYENGQLRTLAAMLGAARGCRVLYANWAYESLKASKWVCHYGHEVPYFKNLSQKAYIERHAFGLMRAEFGYDVFQGSRICITPKAEKRDCVEQLLTLCGAILFDEFGSVWNDDMAKKNRRDGPNMAPRSTCDQESALFKYDAIIGTGPGQISSKWVFDSVASTRMRSLRRYTNLPLPQE